MSNAKVVMGQAANTLVKPLEVEDVFSTYLYEGNASGQGATAQSITNDIDLSGEGGLVWIKNRDSGGTSAWSHYLFDTERGATKYVRTNLTNANGTSNNSLSAFNSDGFTLGETGGTNNNGDSYASWTFRKAPKFFDVVTWTGDGVNGREIAHNLGVEPGMFIVKATNISQFWWVYHRSTGAASNLFLDSSAAATTDTYVWNNTSPTSSVFTVSNYTGLNASGNTYVAYLFAHNDGDGEFGPDADADIIKCGSYTGNGSTDGPEIDLGFEPQWLMIKRTTSTENWAMYDSMRGIAAGVEDTILIANGSNNESSYAGQDDFDPTATGFKIKNNSGRVNESGNTYIYMAIRRGPMAVPESGTEVFALDQSDGTEPSFDSGFPVDFAIRRTYSAAYTLSQSRLTGARRIATNVTDAEISDTSNTWDHMEGWSAESNTSYYSWMWKRAPGYFDAVAYSGNSTAGRAVDHSLGVAPEMIWMKCRTNTQAWQVYHKDLDANGQGAAASGMGLNLNIGEANVGVWNSTFPTDTSFYLNAEDKSNETGQTYIAYLFATLAGVSKVGSYTGNGTSQTIDCGFTSGARFILIKRTDHTGNWYFWDTEQGIITGNSPHMTLNTTDAQVTTDDSIDPASSGFIVNQVSATDVNVSSATYIFYAIA